MKESDDFRVEDQTQNKTDTFLRLVGLVLGIFLDSQCRLTSVPFDVKIITTGSRKFSLFRRVPQF